jgi:hypothetical protein
MSKIWIVISVIVLFIIGCTKVSYEDVISCESPNWTSDGKVVFVREKEVWKIEEDIGVRTEIVSDSTWLYEINSDGTGKENKGLLFVDTSFGGAGLSSAGDWVVFGDGDGNIWVVGRNGTNLQEIGEGRNPDFSPDASQIVYEKPNQGIWIMDRDGGNNHQIISDTSARYPAWSPDDTLIAYGEWQTHVITITGDSLKTYNRHRKPDWGPQGSNLIIATSYYGYPILTNIFTNESDTLDYFQSGYGIKWSPDSLWLCSETSQGILVIMIDGTNSHYITP